MSKAVCDNDCFNCKYDDCIKSDTESGDRKEYMHEYYLNNKEKYQKWSKAYREKHRDELNAKARKKYYENCGYASRREYSRKYYAEHKEELKAKRIAKQLADPGKTHAKWNKRNQTEKRKIYMRDYMRTYRGKANEIVPES